MKNTLRSLLALVLALCLVVGMCPAAFAAEVDSFDDYTQEEIIAKLVKFLQEFWPKADPTVDPTDPATYEPKETSYYVALGDSSAAGGYATMLAGELGIESYNLAKADMVLADETFEIIEKNSKDISQADLISLGYSAHVFLNNAITEAMNSLAGTGSGINMDWEALVGAEYARDVELLLAALRVKLTEKGITGKKQDLIVCMVEVCAYSASVYAINLPEIIAAIRKYNPTATVVVVGMYDPANNVDIYMDGNKVEIDDYMEQILDAVDSHASDCCATTANAAFVSANNAETISEAQLEHHEVDAQNAMGMLSLAQVVRTKMTPSEAGNKYIMNRILQGIVPTFRVAGNNRFETALKAADQLKASLDIKRFETIIVAAGTDFADALSGSYLATVKDAPILLSYRTNTSNNDKSIIEYVKANLETDGIVYVLGGTKAVSDTLDKSLTRAGYTVSRIAGSNRFETNLEILKEAGVGNKDILICTGLDFADSLAASATGLPILLVYGNKLLDSQAAYLKSLNNRNLFHIIGGEKAVSGDMQTAVSSYGTVDRVKGDNRIATSVEIADRFFENVDKIVLANAYNYPDGLCGGALGYSMGAPLLLTYERYEEPIASYVVALGIERGIILGGDKAVTDAAVDASFAK